MTSESLSLAFCARCDGRRVRRRRAAGRPDDDRLRAGALGGRTGARQRFDDAHRPGELQAARLSHFADDENLLAAILIHGDADLRILQVALGQAVANVGLDRLHAEPTGLQPAEQRKGERAVRPHDVLAGQLRLVDDRDREHVVRADDVLRLAAAARHKQTRSAASPETAPRPRSEAPAARPAEMCRPQHDRPHSFRSHAQVSVRTHTSE